MNFEELFWDKKLHIDTAGRDESRADNHHNPYQPTYYPVLLYLKDSGYISDESVLLDYGCGKGRVLFFFNYFFRCKCIGIECEDVFYYDALKNRESYKSKYKNSFGNIEVVRTEAEKYEPDSDVDTVFFFNPFSLEIMKAVIHRIKQSYYDNPRRIRLIFYYLMENVEQYLSEQRELQLEEDIDCRQMVNSKDKRHKLKIYEIS